MEFVAVAPSFVAVTESDELELVAYTGVCVKDGTDIKSAISAIMLDAGMHPDAAFVIAATSAIANVCANNVHMGRAVVNDFNAETNCWSNALLSITEVTRVHADGRKSVAWECTVANSIFEVCYVRTPTDCAWALRVPTVCLEDSPFDSSLRRVYFPPNYAAMPAY